MFNKVEFKFFIYYRVDFDHLGLNAQICFLGSQFSWKVSAPWVRNLIVHKTPKTLLVINHVFIQTGVPPKNETWVFTQGLNQQFFGLIYTFYFFKVKLIQFQLCQFCSSLLSFHSTKAASKFFKNDRRDSYSVKSSVLNSFNWVFPEFLTLRVISSKKLYNSIFLLDRPNMPKSSNSCELTRYSHSKFFKTTYFIFSINVWWDTNFFDEDYQDETIINISTYTGRLIAPKCQNVLSKTNLRYFNSFFSKTSSLSSQVKVSIGRCLLDGKFLECKTLVSFHASEFWIVWKYKQNAF